MRASSRDNGGGADIGNWGSCDGRHSSNSKISAVCAGEGLRSGWLGESDQLLMRGGGVGGV